MTNKLIYNFKGDRTIWFIIAILSIFSLMAVFSSTSALAYKYQGGNTAYYMIKHLVFLLVGVFITYITHLIPYRIYSRLSQLMLYTAIPLLGITLLFGSNLNDASRWLTVPGIGLSFQTSEFAKIALIMYVARELSKRQEKIKEFKGAFIPIMFPIVLTCALILPANFSTAGMLFGICMVLLFIGRVSLKHLGGVVLAGVVGLSLFVFVMYNSGNKMRYETWKTRIENFVSGGDEGNYQATQSKIAVSTGGLFGKGPGKSQQRNFLPHPYSDFIFAIIIEEWGFLLGALPIVFLYLILLYRAGVIVRHADRTFPAFLAMGLTFGILTQAMINMGVAVNIFPVTGQTLPLVSMGGSSMLFTSVAFGIILNISRTDNVAPLVDNENPEADDEEGDIFEESINEPALN